MTKKIRFLEWPSPLRMLKIQWKPGQLIHCTLCKSRKPLVWVPKHVCKLNAMQQPQKPLPPKRPVIMAIFSFLRRVANNIYESDLVLVKDCHGYHTNILSPRTHLGCLKIFVTRQIPVLYHCYVERSSYMPGNRANKSWGPTDKEQIVWSHEFNI